MKKKNRRRCRRRLGDELCLCLAGSGSLRDFFDECHHRTISKLEHFQIRHGENVLFEHPCVSPVFSVQCNEPFAEWYVFRQLFPVGNLDLVHFAPSAEYSDLVFVFWLNSNTSKKLGRVGHVPYPLSKMLYYLSHLFPYLYTV